MKKEIILHYHLKKEFFEKIKNGEKKIEYRPHNLKYFPLEEPYEPLTRKIKFYLGYPSKKEKEKILDAEIIDYEIMPNYDGRLYYAEVNKCYDLEKIEYFVGIWFKIKK